MLKLSTQQQTIVDAVASTKHDIRVSARAGTGKTTTIVEACRVAGGSIAFFAFNKEIADELKRRAPAGVDVRTFHSFGYAAVRKRFGNNVRPDSDVLFNILDRHFQRHERDQKGPAKKLIGLCKNLLCATDDDTLFDVCLEYDLDVEGFDTASFFGKVRRCLNDCIPTGGSIDAIDFDDMLYLPVVLNLPLPHFDTVFIDEVQDLNPVQHKLIERLAGAGSRIIFVGDERQAIYAFRGANETSMDDLQNLLEGMGRTVTTLPMTVTRRCPKNVVAIAQHYVKDFEAHDDAPGGTVLAVENITPKVGDMVLCRANAPLARVAFRLIREGTPVVIRGRDIGSGLTTLIRRLKPVSIEQLRMYVAEWSRAERDILTARYRDRPYKLQSALQGIEDKANTLDFLAETQSTVEELLLLIGRLFSDDSSKTVVLLSSIHKAKGLEAQTVWLQEFKVMGGAQEANITYVGITRAKSTLYIAPWEGEEMRIPIHLASYTNVSSPLVD